MPWNPAQYHQFQNERFAPFEDLFSLVKVRAHLSVVDLGCGTGELTRRLAERLPESEVLGIDSSPEMLARAREQAHTRLSFEQGSIQKIEGEWDLVFSHAAIHWIDNQRALIPRLLSLVRRGGQLAVQLPSNHTHPSHTLIMDIASEEPFRQALDGWNRVSPVLSIREYAELLHEHGAAEMTVFEKVYPSLLDDSDALAEWTKGSTLVPYFERLPHELHEPFMVRYRERLRSLFPSAPVFYTFRRILFAATRPA
ncbi:MAG TPA: methyltransferase domain-containing protein [Pyrinomonadaceae bacterium]|jgi:trans-aconitate 2-methyltransferase|nr:methyltransferase domain-containing protein [Pyrinomonadaceae bacterium]